MHTFGPGLRTFEALGKSDLSGPYTYIAKMLLVLQTYVRSFFTELNLKNCYYIKCNLQDSTWVLLLCGPRQMCCFKVRPTHFIMGLSKGLFDSHEKFTVQLASKFTVKFMHLHVPWQICKTTRELLVCR